MQISENIRKYQKCKRQNRTLIGPAKYISTRPPTRASVRPEHCKLQDLSSVRHSNTNVLIQFALLSSILSQSSWTGVPREFRETARRKPALVSGRSAAVRSWRHSSSSSSGSCSGGPLGSPVASLPPPPKCIAFSCWNLRNQKH